MRASTVTREAITVVSGALLLVGLYLSSLYSYLLFHSLVEVFSALVACGIFVIVWNSRRFWEDGFFLFVGIAYLFVGATQLLHALAYTGMGVFPGRGTNLPTQLWIVARFIESSGLLIAPFFLGRKLNAHAVFLAYLAAFILLLCSIFAWRVFPLCFVQGTGLTQFKKVSEYVVCAVFAGAIVLLLRRRAAFDSTMLGLIAASLVVSILSELSFTLYTDPYGLANLIGHFLSLASFYLIYVAIIRTALVAPYSVLFRDLKRVQEELRQSEERFRTMADFAYDWEYWVGPDGRCVYMSPSCERITGYSPAEFLEDPGLLGRIVHPADRPAMEEHRKAELDSRQEALAIDFRILRRDGREAWINHACRPVYDSEGTWLGRRATGRDISKRKEAEEEVRKLNQELELRVAQRTAELERVVADLQAEVRSRLTAEARLSEAQRIAHLGNWDWDMVRNELWWSDEVYRIFGAAPQEFGATYEAFLSYVHPDEVALVRQAVDQAAAQHKPYNIDHRIVRPDGTERIVHEQAEVTCDADDRAVRMVGTVQDITARKRAEQAVETQRRRLFSLLQMLPGYVCLVDRDRRVRFANDRFLELFGQPGDKLCHEVLRGQGEPCHFCPAGASFDGGEAGEWEWRRPGGRVFHSWSYPFTDVDGTPMVLMLGMDVTDRKRLEEEVLRAGEDERQRVGRDLHDGLGQMLTGLSCLSQVLQRKLASRFQAEAQDAARIHALLGESLSLTRSLARGLSPVGPKPDSLMVAMRELATTAERMFGLNCDFRCEQPVFINDSIAATHLYRIAQEATHNAVRHGRAKNITIGLALSRGVVVLTVEDDGVGMPQDLRDANGMGLRIMRYRADLIGAAIGFDRRPQGGTAVTCRLKQKSVLGGGYDD